MNNVKDFVIINGVVEKYLGNKENVIVPMGATCIGMQAFSNHEELISVELPDSVVEICLGAFGYCVNLRTVRLSSNLKTIEPWAFFNCNSLSNIFIPKSVTLLAETFSACDNLENVTVEEGNTEYKSVDGVVYNKNTNLAICVPKRKKGYVTPQTSEKVEDKYKSVEEIVCSEDGQILLYVPRDKKGHLEIPQGVVRVERSVIARTKGITSLFFPASLKEIGADLRHLGENFEGIKVDENNPYFLSIDDVLYNKTTNVLLKYPAGKKEEEFSVPFGVTEIGEMAFYQCETLEKVTLSSTVTKIGFRAFETCVNLTTLVLPDGITDIGHAAFRGCFNLTTIHLPNTLTYIGVEAFEDCNKLNKIIFHGTKEEWNKIIIDNFAFPIEEFDVIFTE